MITEAMNSHEIIFVIIAFIFTFGGFYAVQKKLPEMLKKSMDAVDAKIDRLDLRLEKSDKANQDMQIKQAINEEKVTNVQSTQFEMKNSIAKITDMLNNMNRGQNHGDRDRD